MKNTFILAISILSFLFSSFVAGKTISIEYAEKVEFPLTWSFGYIYKSVDNIQCWTGDDYDFKVFYNDIDLGRCTSRYKIVGLPQAITHQTSGTFYVQNLSSKPITVNLEAADLFTGIGDTVTKTVPGKINLTANVADSIDFGTIRTNKSETGISERRELISSGNYGSGKGTITVKPSIVYNYNGQKMGEMQDENNKNFILYNVDVGGNWDDKAGGWVYKDDCSHDLVLNPKGLKLAPGQYSGMVTVIIASE